MVTEKEDLMSVRMEMRRKDGEKTIADVLVVVSWIYLKTTCCLVEMMTWTSFTEMYLT